VDAFRTRKETIKATYTAAEAQTRINEAFTGISEEMGDVGMAIQRAEDKTAQMQARAGAIDELMASGALDDAVGGKRDDIQSELDMMSANSDVERELAMLKGELTAGAPKQLEGSAPNGANQGTQGTQGTQGYQAPQQDQQPQQQQQPQEPYAPQYTAPQQAEPVQPPQQAQPAGLPGRVEEPQDGDRS
jgi:phage shock protein A